MSAARKSLTIYGAGGLKEYGPQCVEQWDGKVDSTTAPSTVGVII